MKYVFVSLNKGTIEVKVEGLYRESFCKDIEVYIGGDGEGRVFEETDDADEIMQHLVDEGVQFESARSMAFNREYIQSVLIDGDATEQGLLDEAASWDDTDIRVKLAYIDLKRGTVPEVVANSWGRCFWYRDCEPLMDKGIAESLHGSIEGNQAFFDAYAEAHEQAFGEQWVLDTENPQW